jgi:ABC-2 type transport system permease protein
LRFEPSAAQSVPLVMMLLSGLSMPLKSMLVRLKDHVVIGLTPRFVIFSQDVVCRRTDASIVWPEIVATAAIGSVLSAIVPYRNHL